MPLPRLEPELTPVAQLASAVCSGKPCDNLKADGLETRHPLQRVGHIRKRELARDEACRVELAARHEGQQLGIVRVRIAERAHQLPLRIDEDIDGDGDLAAFLLRGESNLDM